VVDIALYEAVFNCMESLLPEYSAFGVVREPAGSALPGIAPSNAYRCADGAVLIGGNGDSIFRRLMDLIGRPDLRDAPDLASNDGRAKRASELDAAIGAWTGARPLVEVLDGLTRARVPAGRIYTAQDIAEDPHYRAREMIRRITTAEGYALDVPGVVPKLCATPGRLSTLAPALGQHTAEVLRELGVSESAIAELRAKNVIATGDAVVTAGDCEAGTPATGDPEARQ
jgi:formyl-CoA transferase